MTRTDADRKAAPPDDLPCWRKRSWWRLATARGRRLTSYGLLATGASLPEPHSAQLR